MSTDAEQQGVLRSAAVVGACTGLSRLLGFVREILMAVLFGTSLAKSAFDIAFLIPNLFRRLFGEGALAAAFVPVFTETLEREGPERAGRLAGRVMTMLGLVLGAAVAAGMLVATLALVHGGLGARASAVLPLLRIMLPYAFFICTVALCMAILNSLHHFLVPAATPVLLNVVWIMVLAVVCPRMGPDTDARIRAVAWGVLAAGSIQLAVQAPALLRLRISLPVSVAWDDPKVRKVLLLMGPVALAMGVFQVNVVVDRVLAFMVADWGPAALTYAERLIYLPLGIFATAMGTVLLPTFSRQVVRDQHGRIADTLGRALRNLLLVTAPAAVGLLVLAGPVVRLAFAWRGGAFGEESVVRTARAVAFYAPGLVVFSVYKLLVPAFYAMQDMRTPVRIAARVVALNFVLNVAFILSWPAGYKHAGIALATVLSSCVNCVALARILGRRVGDPGWRGLAGTAARTGIAAAVMGLAVGALHPLAWDAAFAHGMPAKAAEAVAMAAAVAVGVGTYALLSFLLCSREVRALAGELRSGG